MPLTKADGCGWRTVTADAQVTTRPCLLHAAVILASSTGGDATLYEGQDASSGRLIATLKGSATVSNPILWQPGLFLERGLFVDVGSNVTEVHVALTELEQQAA